MNPLEMASHFYGEGLNFSPSNFPQKVERKLKKKKKQKKQKKAKDEPRVFLGEWVDDGVEPSSISSDESIKSNTTRINKRVSSSFNTCHMAECTNSNVSDDDSDTPSFEDLLDLIHEQQGVMKRQAKEIKNLNALKDLNASLATNFEDLMCKFKLLSKEHEELKLKFESINDINDFLEMKQTIPCAIPISRVDASIS